MSSATRKNNLAALSLGALGVVYGDIGTSPLYTVQTVFDPENGIALLPENIIGAASALFWGLMLVVTLKYVTLVLRANNRGEGGILALLALAISTASAAPRRKTALLLLGVLGAALFYGDSVITPAISVLSAVEGLEVVSPAFSHLIVPLSVVIILLLFMVQRHGTSMVGRFFGPIMILWFSMLGIIGGYHIVKTPAILAALNPAYAVEFLVARGPGVFLAIGALVLALTGAEALYADMGHFGSKAIRLAWGGMVLPGLALNYLGQGALLLQDPKVVANPFFHAFPDVMLWPMIGLATLATIIASQAVITGTYSMTRQAIQLGLLPRMRVLHTSASESGQIYMPVVNKMLLFAVLLAILGFESSASLASAYGIAVTATMLITTILTFFVIRYSWRYPLWLSMLATGSFIVLDILLVVSCAAKFLHGGWFPVSLGVLLTILMWTWREGRELVMQRTRADSPDLMPFIQSVQASAFPRVERTAVFLVSDPHSAPQALMHNLKHNMVLHEKNLIMNVDFADIPWVSDQDRLQIQLLAPGFWRVTIRYGFMDVPDIPRALEQCNEMGVEINPFTTSYFLNRATVVPSTKGKMARWREELFASLSRNAGSVAGYFNIPGNAVIELGSRIHL